ncbi:hypothetical protein MNBD_GAMMA22-1595 [hydrothermal vent metagenome]|uniref:DUF3592 domain-containing protein n=1 Tax=hydrothermal vent metagenome TaxID=652676 RepID=A0A3B1A3J8_9ZZZZ
MNSINRKVPKNTAITIIFGRKLTLTGWFVFAFLMIFGWGFGGHSDVSFLYFTGDIKVTTGRVIESDETNMEINERSVWVNTYEYIDDEGFEYLRNVYTTGYGMRSGQQLTVEYPVDYPKYGRVPGKRSAEFSSWLLLTYLLPLIGLSLVYFGIRRGLRDYKMLKSGIITKAKLVQKKATNTTVNDSRVYALTFEFKAQDQKTYQKMIKTHQTADFEDDEFERLFYDPSNPTVSTLVDDLAGDQELDDSGNIVILNPKLPLKPIVWPIICVAPHLWYFSTLL